MKPRSSYGIEVVRSKVGGGFDVNLNLPAMEDDPARKEWCGVKGTSEDANVLAREEHLREMRKWSIGQEGPMPFLKLWGVSNDHA